MRPPGAVPILVLTALAVFAAPAAAATRTVSVPLDRTGAVPGTVALRVLTLPATSGKPKGTLFVLAGGPGDGNVAYFTRRRDVLDTVRSDWDVVTFDQRGTGRSGRLSCPEYESGVETGTSVPACAARLGAASSLYTSAASADDLDAVRAALGVKKVSVYGLSYGTWVAQTYAKRHRANLDTLILDSVVSPGLQNDPFALNLFGALPSVVRATCQGGLCKGIASDPYADLVALSRKLQAGPLTGTRIDGQGRPQSQVLVFPLAALAVSLSDVNTDVRRQLPAAMRAALGGDPALLLRLVEGATTGPHSPPDRFAPSLNLVTTCEEQHYAWDRSLPPGPERVAETQRRLEQIPASRFAPVDRSLVPSLTEVGECAYWPNAAADPLDTRRLPDVPTLILNGDADLRTPLSAAREVAAQLPRKQLLVIANTGHNTLSSSFTDCARLALADFLGGRRAKACGRSSFRVAQPPPGSPGATTASRVAAAVMTADDAVAQIRMRVRSAQNDASTFTIGGLLGGVIAGGVKTVTLKGDELVKGLRVSGTVKGDGTGRIILAGAVTGSLTLSPDRVSGTLGGAKVAAARPDAGYL